MNHDAAHQYCLAMTEIHDSGMCLSSELPVIIYMIQKIGTEPAEKQFL